MATSSYIINKGIGKSVEFKGLRAQYIWYLGAGVLVLIGLFILLYLIGLNQYLVLVVVFVLGTLMVIKIYAMSNKYGEHGLSKQMARRSLPCVVKCNSRKIFAFGKISRDGDRNENLPG